MFFSWIQNAFIDIFAKDLYAALLFFALSCVVGAVLFLALKTTVKILKKRRHKFIPEREVEFMLPDRENTYVRSRLATVLNTDLQKETEREEELPLAFAHAQSLLHKLWFVPLSQAERLEMQDLEDKLTKYSVRTRFNAKDVNTLNDVFSRLLKLSAKHGV